MWNCNKVTIFEELSQYRYVALDIETTGLNWQKDKIFGYAIAYGNYKTKWFNIEDSSAIPVIKYLLTSPKHRLVGHNSAFDLSFIRAQLGLEAQHPFHCTMTMAFLINENRKVGLKELAKEHNLCDLTVYDVVKKQKRGVKNDYSLIDRELMSTYCQIDASNSLKLFNLYKDQIQLNFKKIYQLEMSVIPVLMDMERTGVLVDRSYLESIEPKLKQDLDASWKDVVKSVGYAINVNSTVQLRKYFYEDLKLTPPRMTERGEPSTDRKTLIELNHPTANKIIKYRELEKDYSTYVVGILNLLDSNNVLHTSFNATDRKKTGGGKIGAITGRLSSSNPDLQNIPQIKKNRDGTEKTNIRRAFITRPGSINYYFDYASMELVGAAHFSRCPRMLKALINKEDLHSITASKVYNIPINDVTKHPQRDIGKKINFSVTYGIGNRSLAERINLDIEGSNFTVEDGKKFKKAFFTLYPEILDYYDTTRRQLQVRGYVETLFGRRGRIPLEEAYKAPNFTIQGCVTGDSHVLIKDVGYVPISSLSGKVNIWDGNKYVCGHVTYSGKKEVVKIEFWNGQIFKCSKEHNLLLTDADGRFYWRTPVAIKDSKQKHVVITNEINNPMAMKDVSKVTGWIKHYHQDGEHKNKRKLTLAAINKRKELGIVLGRLLSDGSISKAGLHWLVAEHEISIIEDMQRILSVFPYSVYSTKRENRAQKLYRINVFCKYMRDELLNSFDEYGIPKCIWRDKEILRGFLRGFFDGDGTVNKKGDIILTIGNPRCQTLFPEMMQQMLALLNIKTRLRRYANCVHLKIARIDNVRFAKRVGFINSVKQGKIQDNKERVNRRWNAERVKHIIFTGVVEDMYDVVNTDTGQFMVDGIVTHNSCADIIKQSMVDIYHKYGRGKIILQVHDELQIQNISIEQARDIKVIMEKVVKLRAPLRVEVSCTRSSWGDKEEIAFE